MSTTAFPINPTLTAIAIAYKNPQIAFIADAVLPRRTTGKKFAYTVYSAAQGYTIPDTKVGRKSEPTQVEFGGTQVNAEVVDWGLDDLVPNDETEAFNSAPKAPGAASPVNVSTMMLTHLIQLDRERRVAQLVFNAASYAAGMSENLAAADQWDNQANSDPVAKLSASLDKPLIRPNTLVLGRSGWSALRRHPKIVQAVNATSQGAGLVSRQQVADLFELKEVLVGESFVNTAKKGQAASFSRVWGKSASLLYVDPNAAAIDQPTFGFTAQWGSRIAGSIPEPKKGLRGGETVRVGESLLEVVAANDLGYYLGTVVA
ncbi:MAG: phage capsid protein [Rubrivivax sp.]